MAIRWSGKCCAHEWAFRKKGPESNTLRSVQALFHFADGSVRLSSLFRNDPEVPVKYGVRLPVSMTCGISGIYVPSDPFTMR